MKGKSLNIENRLSYYLKKNISSRIDLKLQENVIHNTNENCIEFLNKCDFLVFSSFKLIG